MRPADFDFDLIQPWYGPPGQGKPPRKRLLRLTHAQRDARDEGAAVFDEIRDVALRMTTGRDNIVASAGLSSARVILLERIERLEPRQWTIAEHARALGRARQSVRRVALALEGLGLIERRRNRYSRKARLLALTDKGFDWLREATVFEGQWIADVACYYARRDVQHACWILRALRDRAGRPAPDF